jgi:NAD-dependent deacetylase
MPLDILSRVGHAIAQSRRLTVLTGAGMSAASGVPTFRGTGGLWKTFRAEDLATPQAFTRDPAMVWEWYDWRRQQIASCAPNAGHRVLARWSTERTGMQLVTQNVDGLHERAGTRRVLRLHGSIWHVRCLRSCTHGAPIEVLDVPLTPLPPRCGCGALLRPDVVWFGEPLDQRVWSAAERAASGADVLLAIGTSSQVYPAAALIPLARAAGAFVVEINPEPSAGDVDERLALPADEALTHLDEHLSGSNA